MTSINTKPAQRKPYSAPELTVHGTIEAITAGGGAGAAETGGTKT